METLKVCRICLVVDVNMYDLQTQPLQTYFEPIIGNPLTAMELPHFACFECIALVKKYYYFREKCLRGQGILYGILRASGKITKQDIQKIDRPSLQLTSNLTINEITQDNAIYDVYDEDRALQIKREMVVDDDKHRLKIENNIKEEDCFGDLALHLVTSDDFDDKNKQECIGDLSVLSSDDEASLSSRTNHNYKEAGIKPTKRRKMDKKPDDSEDTKAEDTTAEICIELTEIVRPKSRRDRVRKSNTEKGRRANTSEVDDRDSLVDDLEEYVTIVKLSMAEQLREIDKRQQSSNYLNAPYQCNLCYKGFVYTHAWEHHRSKHDPSAGDKECPVCKLRFKTKCSLYKHGLNHEIKYVCKACSYASTSMTQAKRHQRWHKGVTYECQYCGEISTKWTSYLSHVRIKHPSEYICDVCGNSFVSELGLTLHKSRTHKHMAHKKEVEDNKDAERYCAECDVKFKSVDAFKRHTITSVKHTHINHSNGCRVCGKTFKNPEELRLHRKIHARKFLKYYGNKPTDTTSPIKCEHCSKEISSGREYWNHFRRAHPDKDYPVQKNHVCDICGKCFQSVTFLAYHQRTHTEERAFKCPTCGKAFRNKGYLQLHEKTHSEARPFPCTVCLKAFKFKGALDRHSRCHTGVKPFECELCGKAFTQSNSRKLHVRTVHMKQPAPPRSRLQRKNKP